MLLTLLKKDFLIIKKYILLMFLICAIIPPFLLWRVSNSENASLMGFVLSSIFSIFMLLQYNSQKEHQYPKAATLLCTTPFPRKFLVLSKYVFCIAIYASCCIIFGIETWFLPQLKVLPIEIVALLFFVISIFIGIYLPIQYKLGYEKTRFVFAVIIVTSPYLLPQLLKMESLNSDFLSRLSPLFLYSGAVLIGFAILAVSFFISSNLYDKSDLS